MGTPTSTEGRAAASQLRRLGTASPSFAEKAAHWAAYRARLRAPRACAWLEGELPMRSIPLHHVAGAPADGVIPHVVHQTWVNDRFGRHHARALRVMRDLNPDYAFRISTDADLDDYMRTAWGHHPISEVYDKAHYGPLKTDIWRYCTLFAQGGVYLDIAKGVAAPLRELIAQDDGGVVSYEARSRVEAVADQRAAARMLEPGGVLINWLMAFRPEHPVLGEVIDAIVRDYPLFRGRTSKNPKADILRLTGPLQLTASFAAVLSEGRAADVRQHSFDFGGTAIWELKGSWVRYTTRAPYVLARDSSIVD